MRSARLALATALAALALVPALAVAAGPPFPDPVTDQAVYDTAGVLEASTITTVEAQIDRIEADTGAEIAVYTQLVDGNVDYVQAEQHAIALMDQWGVGRAGVNDGLVILFDLYQDDPCHGQVQLYAGSGYRETWLSNDDRQRIFENDMLPHLRDCDIDGALLAAMDKISAVPGARQLNAVLGLILAPAILILTVAYSLFRWFRAGRDPVYLDDPSVLMPAPPPGLTPAAGAALRDGSVARRALTAASLDLAARGRIAFQAIEKPHLLGKGQPELGIFTRDSMTQDPVEQARLERVRRRPLDEGTVYLLGRLHSVGGSDGWIDPDDILKLGTHVSTFNSNLEKHLVKEGWYREPPTRTSGRWAALGVVAFVLAIGAIIVGANLPSSGIILIGISLIVSAVWLFVISSVMPARTQAGAVIVAMLEAYRRTLDKTMAQARSMGQVVEESAIPLIEDPDDAVVWGVALGLQEEVEKVLQRSAEDFSAGRVSSGYFPLWYSSGSGSWGDARGSGWAPGMMSSSPIPNFGGMMAALGTIGNSPSSSGSGGGGFSGGGSGGGGGGAGGGF
jgi:hypothetical protein